MMSNAELIEEVRAAHWLSGTADVCVRDEDDWPCDAIRLAAALEAPGVEGNTARAEALDEAACIADGFGVVGVAPSADDYWGGHNDAAAKITTAIREVAMCDAEAAAERNVTDNYPQMKAAWHQEYGGSPKHDDPSPEFEAGWNAHKKASAK